LDLKTDIKGSTAAVILLFLIIVFCGCRKDAALPDNYLKKPVCSSTFIPKEYDFKVVGFYPSWKAAKMTVHSIPWEKLTRIVYAFALPNADGTLNTESLDSTGILVETAHKNGVQVYFSVGGADGSGNFPVIATNSGKRDLFIKEVRQYLFQNCLDGVDIDWEYWSGYATNVIVPAESNALVTLLKELRNELSPFNIGISIDVGANEWAGKHFFNTISEYIDDLQVMAYDFTGSWTGPGPHSSFEDAIGSGYNVYSTGLAYWVNYRGWPKSQVILGVPFYGKDFDRQAGYIEYSEITKLYPGAYLTDKVNNIYYNGIITMARKAKYVADNKYPGIMIWEITQDSKTDSLSLLNAIHNGLYN